MTKATDIAFLIIIIPVLIADIIVFTKCQTYKTCTSLLISVCLGLDLVLRVGQLSLRIQNDHPEEFTPQTFIMFHDFTQYLVTIVGIALLS